MKKRNSNISLGNHLFELNGNTLNHLRIGIPLTEDEITQLIKYCNIHNVKYIRGKSSKTNISVESFIKISIKNVQKSYSDFKNEINPILDNFKQDSPSMDLRRKFGLIA